MIKNDILKYLGIAGEKLGSAGKAVAGAGASIGRGAMSAPKDLIAAGSYGASQLKSESTQLLKLFSDKNFANELAIAAIKFGQRKESMKSGVISSLMKPLLGSISEVAIAGFMNSDGTLNQERYDEYMEGKGASNILNMVSQNPAVAERVNELREWVKKNPGVMSREGKELTQVGKKEVIDRISQSSGAFKYLNQPGEVGEFGTGFLATPQAYRHG